MQKEKLCISFSGGRTSAFMTKKILDNWSDKYEIVVTYANTGKEDDRTLDFIHKCDTEFGFKTVWMESVVHEGERKGCTHKLVDYKSASRKAEPFENIIRKYGIPNLSYLHCTREMKLNPMKSYLKSIGFENCIVALGIRFDEDRRVSTKAEENRIIYPCVDDWPVTKRDVIMWWKDQPFDLDVEEFEGNCHCCFKKSLKKQFMQIAKDPSVFDFYRYIEKEYPSERKYFRENMNTDELFEMYQEMKNHEQFDLFLDYEGDSGCSQSCEVFPT